MKKLLSILLCIILCIATLSCNSTSAEKEQKKAKDSSTTDSSASTQSSESTSTSTQNTELTESIQTTIPIDPTDPNYLYVKEMKIEKIVISSSDYTGTNILYEYCFPEDSEKIKYVLDYLDSIVLTENYGDIFDLDGGSFRIEIIYNNETRKNFLLSGNDLEIYGNYDGSYKSVWYKFVYGESLSFHEFFDTLE